MRTCTNCKRMFDNSKEGQYYHLRNLDLWDKVANGHVSEKCFFLCGKCNTPENLERQRKKL